MSMWSVRKLRNDCSTLERNPWRDSFVVVRRLEAWLPTVKRRANFAAYINAGARANNSFGWIPNLVARTNSRAGGPMNLPSSFRAR